MSDISDAGDNRNKVRLIYGILVVSDQHEGHSKKI